MQLLKLVNSQPQLVKWAKLAGWGLVKTIQRAVHKYFQDEAAESSDKESNASEPMILSIGLPPVPLWEICRRAPGVRSESPEAARGSLRGEFPACANLALGRSGGLPDRRRRTGRAGVSVPNPESHVPVDRRPRDLTAVGYKPGADAFPKKVRGSVASMRIISLGLTMTALPLRRARSMDKNSKSAGSRIRLTCSQCRLKALRE